MVVVMMTMIVVFNFRKIDLLRLKMMMNGVQCSFWQTNVAGRGDETKKEVVREKERATYTERKQRWVCMFR